MSYGDFQRIRQMNGWVPADPGAGAAMMINPAYMAYLGRVQSSLVNGGDYGLAMAGAPPMYIPNPNAGGAEAAQNPVPQQAPPAPAPPSYDRPASFAPPPTPQGIYQPHTISPPAGQPSWVPSMGGGVPSGMSLPPVGERQALFQQSPAVKKVAQALAAKQG